VLLPTRQDLTNAENGRDVPIEVTDGTTIPFKYTSTINTTDDDGDPITLVLPNVIYYSPGLIKWLFSIFKFTSKYNNKAHIERNFINFSYFMAAVIPLYPFIEPPPPQPINVKIHPHSWPDKPIITKSNKTLLDVGLIHQYLGHCKN
jgi:hypothetical protein